MTDAFCSALSLQVGEPLAGTAVADTDRFLVLEHDAQWGPKGVEDSGLPESVVAYLHGLGRRHPRLRVQLMRGLSAPEGAARPEQGGAPGSRLYLAESGPAPALYALTLAELAHLATLDLDGWLSGTAPAPGERESEPLYLVCTHGKRDRCCALLGVPVYRALRERVGERAVQTTHLGGHRFAATLLLLPLGLCYGRVLAEEAAPLIAATERGAIYDLARVRGRTALPSEAQAAEVMLRQQLGELQLDAVTLHSVEPLENERFCVRFLRSTQAGTEEHALEVARAALPATPPSCGAAPKPVSLLLRVPAAPG